MVNWFNQVMVKARLPGTATVVFLAITGDGDDDGILGALLLPETCRNLVAVHAGKPEIQKHELGSVDAGRLDSGRPVVCRLDVMSQELQ